MTGNLFLHIFGLNNSWFNYFIFPGKHFLVCLVHTASFDVDIVFMIESENY